MAVSPDGLTVAYAGFSPNLFIAKSLPSQGETTRGSDFYRALDDLRFFTASTARIEEQPIVAFTNRSEEPVRIDYVAGTQRPTLTQINPGATYNPPENIPTGLVFLFIDPESSEQLESYTWAAAEHEDDEGPVGISVSFPGNADEGAQIAEMLGDVARREGKYADAVAHYTTEIKILQETVLDDPSKAAPQGKLTTALLNRLAVTQRDELDDGGEVLPQATEFWQQLMLNPKANPAGWQHLLRFQLQLLDHQIAAGEENAKESLTTMISLWAAQSAGNPADRFFRYAGFQFCQRLSDLYPSGGHEEAIDQLLADQPALAVFIGDFYAKQQNWQRAIDLYSKNITDETSDATLLVGRAEAFSAAGQLEQADADWKRALDLKPEDDALRQRWLQFLTDQEQWESLAAYYTTVLDDLPTRRAQFNQVARIIRRGDGVFEALRALSPTDSLLHVSLARDAVLRSDWEKAAAEYPQEMDEGADPDEWYECAAALLVAGKLNDYQAYLQRTVDEKGEGADDALVAYALARMAAVSPEETIPWTQAIEWAEQAATKQDRAWYTHVAGLANLRAEKLDKAMEWLEKSAATTWHPELNQLALCLAHAAGGEDEKASDYLKQARAWLAAKESGRTDGYYAVQVTDWLEFNILLAEADAFLDADSDPQPDESEPAESDAAAETDSSQTDDN